MASSISFGDANSGFQAGIINELHQHLPPEQPETLPNPSIIIPFGQDPDFVGRGTILDQLHDRCAVPGSRTAVVGLGGVGKSQLAIEYAYRTHERSSDTWIFWVHASNAARFEQSYRDIANRVKIPGRQNPKANIFQLVHDWLWDARKGRWVLILDNVDDAGFLVKAGSRGQEHQTSDGGAPPLVSYLPQCQHGSILVTTRSRDAALQLVEQRNTIPVDPMSEIDAIILLEKKLDQQDDPDNVAALAAALEYMPLAIVQAAAYISQRAPRCSVQQYVEEFQKGDRKRASLLNFEGGQLRRDVEAKNSIIITWQISFDHIRQTRPSAADLLSLMSFFDRQGIPKSLLRRQKTADSQPFNEETNNDDYQDEADDDDSSTDDERSTNSDDVLEDDVSTLRAYSFTSVTATGASFEMHSLVQLATRKWLETYGQQERWKQQYIRNLNTEFPTGEYENWATCQSLFPHVKLAAAQKPAEQDSLIEWASLLYRAAWYSLEIGNWPDAETMSMRSMSMRKKKLGVYHPDTLSSMANLAATYWNQGRWDAAEKLFVQVMEIRKKKLGVDHPNTLSSMANLAATYRNQGRWDAAEKLFVQVMEMSKKKLGVDHPNTLSSMANLAATYWNQGQWDAAEELFVQVMEIRKKKLGADHPNTLSSMANLASTYWNQGRWDAAEELFVQVMEIRKKKLGADHPDTLSSMANLVSTYWNQGRWNAAEELFVQVMEIRKKKLGGRPP